jgi:hypothetical protein
MNDSTESPLVFPTDYPIKVVGRVDPALRSRVDAVFARHVHDLSADRIRERDSAEGNFVSITYSIVARSREQVTALVQELVATEGVLMVI